MFEIKTVMVERQIMERTGSYKICTSTTMGRLIKHMLDRGHYGKREEAIAGYIVEKYFGSDQVYASILQQIEDIYRRGSKPFKILLGCAEIEELREIQFNTDGHLSQHFCFMDEYGRRSTIHGLPFTVVRRMSGVVVMDKQMASVES